MEHYKRRLLDKDLKMISSCITIYWTSRSTSLFLGTSIYARPSCCRFFRLSLPGIKKFKRIIKSSRSILEGVCPLIGYRSRSSTRRLRKMTATFYAIRSAYVEDRRHFSKSAPCERATQKLSAHMKVLIAFALLLILSFLNPLN
jgi:hypothetical protein